MHDVIDNLYATFAHYRIGDDFVGCACCVRPEHSARLATASLRDLTYDDLERYSRKAISTWGTTHHFKHFLPRLFELTVEHRDDFLDLAVVFGKLSVGHFELWPKRERDAVNRFFDGYWGCQLASPIVGAFDDSMDTVLSALSNALPSVQRFLDAWLMTDTDNAKRHLASFILNNSEPLLVRGRLINAFWDASGQAHREVIHWLLSDDLLGYLQGPDNAVLRDDFSYAWPQLMAIRSTLGEAPT